MSKLGQVDGSILIRGTMNSVPSFLPIDLRCRQVNQSAAVQESQIPPLCQYFQIATNSKVIPVIVNLKIEGMQAVRLVSFLDADGATIQFINPGSNAKLLITGGDVNSNTLIFMI